ncbi:MAG: glycosyltransferase family 4 protein [Flavisolibacter sp.]
MRIVFVSYEYPPDSGFGGIATYVYQISHALSKRNIDVHVVCGTFNQNNVIVENEHLTIYRIQCNSRKDFSKLVPAILKKIHDDEKIELIEAPEYGAESLYIKPSFPEIPLVVKFHTPAYLIKQLNDYYYDKQWHRKIKHVFAKYKHENDIEYQAAMQADYLTCPSVSLGDIICKDWKIERNKIVLSPNPYIPDKLLLNIQPDNSAKTVLYVGRLETRKGVYNLSKAIPEVLKKVPDAKFIFLGKNDRGPWRKETMKEILIKELDSAIEHTEFIDQVPLTEIPYYLSKASVCVFPSLWENFPYVCLEAMAAARGIVASRSGGMVEMIGKCNGGLLVDPHSVQEIVLAITNLLQDAEEKVLCGIRSRQHILNFYSNELIEKLIEQYLDFAKKIV